MVGTVIAFATSMLIGYFITSLVLQPGSSEGLRLALAVPTGIGLCSLIDFIFRRPMFTVETIVGVLLFGLWLWRRKPSIKNLAALTTYRVPVLVLLLLGVLVGVLVIAYGRVAVTPFGGWDGWMIWNSHARFIHRDAKQWQQHIEHTAHPDYPLLVPLMVVRSWRFVGGEVPGAGGIINLLLTFSGVGALAAFLAERRSLLVSVLIALVALATPLYLIFAALQEADAPLSVFVLCAIGLVCLFFESAPDRLSILGLAGFMAGCAGWTKNEGLLFILAISVALLIPAFEKPRLTLRRFGAFATGLALPLAVIAFFKLTIAPQTDLFQNRQYEEIVGRIFDVNRYMMISEHSVELFQNFGGWEQSPALPLLALLLLSGIDRRAMRNTGWLTGLMTLLIVLGGYYCIYVITPLGLEYHLNTSYFRLLMHIWPAMLLLAGLTLYKLESGTNN